MIGPFALVAFVQVAAPAQQLAPGTRYDPTIPTLEQVAGHDFGEEITPPDEVVRYMQALADAAPERSRLIRYAESWEGRPLLLMIIGSAERMSRLQEVEAGLGRLADPRGLSDAEAERLIADLPVVTALFHGIHGNEISSSGAAMAEAYHLLAARGDTTVNEILSQSLVLIEPMENPDGRARFLQQNLMARARWPDPTPYSAEHDEPWPGGRTNHYLFDLNRDLFAQSQPESRGRVSILLEYHPQVVVDFHEMGGNSTYFFPPTAPPANPWFGDLQLGLMDVFGRANARAFDRRGFAYFNRDTYDLFYPGYIDGWVTGQGGLGMTYEQASARSLALARSDGAELTYGDGVLHHFTAAITTAATAASHRETILRDYLEFRRQAVEAGRRGPAEYVVRSEHDPGMAERLARMLVANGIEVHRASRAVDVGDSTLPAAGTFVVSMSQPSSRFARNLLDADVAMDTSFVRRQVERRARREPDEIYDLTAWSQPLLWDVDAIPVDRATGAAGPLLEPDATVPVPSPLPRALVGYLLPWGTNTAATVVEALHEGIAVRAAGGAFTLGGRRYGIGTAIVRSAENAEDLPDELGRIAAEHGAEVVPIDDSYVTEGTSLGSAKARALREPSVLLVYDEPAEASSAGWARYVLERRYGQRVTVVRASSLARAMLPSYDVIVFPSGDYSEVVGESLLDELRGWIRDGGTLVTMANSTTWATRADVLSTTAERRGGRSAREEPEAPKTPDQPIEYLDRIVPADEAPEEVPGSILRVILDREHWLSAGTDGDIGVLVEGTRVFSPITLDHGTNVGHYADVDSLVMSGVVWDESRPQLASKAFLIHQPMGSGQVIAFAEDPNYRAYAEETELLFMNAVLLGPGR